MPDDIMLGQLLRPDGPQTVASAATGVPRPALRWKTRLLLPTALMLAVGALLAYSAGDLLQTAVTVEVLPVVVKSSGGGVSGGGVVAQAPGWVESSPFALSVAALADGIVQEVPVLEGQEIKAGQVVARLIDADARIALARAAAEVAQREAELAAAKVAAGQGDTEAAAALAISHEAAQSPQATALVEAALDLERIVSQIDVQRARLSELQVELTTKSKAAQSGVISALPVDLLKARVEGQQAEIKALQVQEKALAARVKRLDVQVATDLAKARAALQAAQALRDEAALRLERMEVRTPWAGVVLARNVQPGAAVTADSAVPVIRLYDPKHLQVRVDVPLSTAAKVGLQQEAEIVVDVLPEQTFRGRVLRIVHEADIQRNTLQFKVAIDEPSPLLKPEMLARVRFLAPPEQVTGRGDERVFAPVSVVGSQPERTLTVWVADLGHNVARQRSVTLGTVRLQDWMEVRSGLNAGDRIIVSPSSDLKDGQRIRAKGDGHGSH